MDRRDQKMIRLAFMVKTLGPSHLDGGYRKTRLFNEKVGFRPLEEIVEQWERKIHVCSWLRRFENQFIFETARFKA